MPTLRTPAIRALAAGAVLLGVAAPAYGQAPAVSRQDLADAYLLVDQIAITRGVPAAQRAEWNRSFDRTTLAFFGGDFPRVLRDMHELAARMTGDSAASSPTRQILPLRVRTEPRVVVPGRSRTFLVQATVMYTDASLGAERALQARLLGADGTELARTPLVVPEGAAVGTAVSGAFDTDLIQNAPGRYRIEVSLPGAALPRVTDVFVLAESPAAVRARLEREIAALPPSTNAQDLAAVRARTALIVDEPSITNTAQFIADPAALAEDVTREVRALAAGQRPYELRTGDYWRTVVGPTGPIPVRVYAPREVAMGARMPIVVALHGAGADENMFLEGYGRGRLRALADSVGFLLVSPATTVMMANPASLDSLVAFLEANYVVDRSTIYLIGHSMGAAASASLAASRRELVRAAAFVAGAGAAPAGGRMSPALYVAAEHDLVIPASRVQAAFTAATAAGASVEYRLAEGWGHTLVVGALLDDVVRWLFSR